MLEFEDESSPIKSPSADVRKLVLVSPPSDLKSGTSLCSAVVSLRFPFSVVVMLPG